MTKTTKLVIRAFSFYLCVSFILCSEASELHNKVIKVIDGDTIVLDDQVYRLAGIDAPEIAQDCTMSSRKWKCGIESANELKKMISTGVNCSAINKDGYNRWIGVCTDYQGRDINALMVEFGWAVAYVDYSKKYIQNEQRAKTNSLGIWRGVFDLPKDYRKAVWLKWSSVAPDPNCPIKGNISSKKDRIYHTPWGSRHYNRTRITESKGERWFCNELDALEAGWRAPIR